MLMWSPSGRPNVQSASPPCYTERRPTLCREPARRKFMFFTWKHGPPTLRLVLPKKMTGEKKLKTIFFYEHPSTSSKLSFKEFGVYAAITL